MGGRKSPAERPVCAKTQRERRHGVRAQPEREVDSLSSKFSVL